MESRFLKRRLFKPRWYPDELYNRWLSWLPLVGLVGCVLMVVVAFMHTISPERAIASQCQMSAGKCYPTQGSPK